MHAILAAVRSADHGELVLSGCCFAVALACSAASWRAMLGGGIRFPDACARYGAGSLANTFLPGRAGDVIRLGLFGRVVPGGTLAVAGAVAAVGAARWLALLPLGIAAAIDDGLPARVVALAALALAPLLVAWLCARGGSRRARLLLAPLRVADRATFAALAIWVSGTVVARIAAATLAGGALGVPHPLAAALLVVPALELAGIVPLTPANVGVSGGAAAFAFHANGLPAHQAVAAGFALHGVETAAGLVVGSVSAGALWWRERHRFVTVRFPSRSPRNGGLVAASSGPSAIRQQGGTMRKWTRRLALVVVASAAAALAASTHAAVRGDGDGHRSDTRTPIRHLVVIFQENVSFDHYFGTYPNAADTGGQPFAAAPHTPSVNGLTSALLTSNPNSSQPARLDSSPTGLAGSAGGQLTCDQDHNYSDEQQAFDGGKMDQFVQSVGTAGGTSPFGTPCNPSIVMDYYDGNTVTAFWNYAQRYAMSDNSFSPTFGPSAPGAVNLVSGDTGSVDMTHTANSPTIATSAKPNADLTADGTGGYSLTSDAQPYWDDCSTRDAVALNGKNIGDELNAAGLSWGWFQGGQAPTTTFAAAAAATGHSGQSTATFIPDEFSGAFTGKVVPPHASNQALCDAVHPVGTALGGSGQWGYKDDYIAHHEPFDYYASTANPHHLSVATDASGNDTLAGLQEIGTDTQSYVGGVPQFDTPNHQYDIGDFDQLVAAIAAHKLPASALPAVSFLKAPGYEDGHAAYSDPADEQAFIVKEINALEKTSDWSSTAVIVNYDDSDGWYDHVYSGVTNPSASPADNLTNTVLPKGTTTSGLCGVESAASQPLGGQQGRCGFGPRQPFLVVSPWARTNAVDHNLSDLASVPNFVEYNWHLPGIAGSFDQALASADRKEHVRFDIAGLFDFGLGGDDDHHSVLGPVQLDPVSGQVDLTNADLSHKNLERVNLSGAILTGANLEGSHLEDGFLPNANLTNANLRHADLRHADISGVIWSNTICPDGSNSNSHGSTCVGHL